MEGCADERQFSIERLSCLPSQLVSPEEDTMRVVEEQRRADRSEKPGCFPSQLSIGNSGLRFLELRCWRRNRQNDLRPPKGRSAVRCLCVGGFHQAVGCLMR